MRKHATQSRMPGNQRFPRRHLQYPSDMLKKMLFIIYKNFQNGAPLVIIILFWCWYFRLQVVFLYWTRLNIYIFTVLVLVFWTISSFSLLN